MRAAHMEALGHLFIAYGISNQGFHVFLATGLTQGDPSPDKEEQDLIVRRMPVGEFEQCVRSGEIKDAATLSAWALLTMKGKP